VEFWWSRPGRLHERELYARPQPGAQWTMTLLNP
jgi:pyridoxine/pyridoxamine 5'-phosphate oxidase